NTYSDLSVLADNQLFDHFVNWGIGEGRSPIEGVNLDQETWGAYAAANEDLVLAFGIEDVDALQPAEIAALASHFFRFGIDEERDGKPELPGDEPTEPSTLTEALAKLGKAQSAKTAYLTEAGQNETLAENQALDEDSTPSEIETAITTEYGAQAADVGLEVGVSNFATRSVTVQDAAISEERSSL